MSARFLSDGEYITGDPEHNMVRLLQLHCPNGFVGQIFVTKDAPYSFDLPGNRVNIWHYELKDGKITLRGPGSDSVRFLWNGEEKAHVMVIDWPVVEDDCFI